MLQRIRNEDSNHRHFLLTFEADESGNTNPR